MKIAITGHRPNKLGNDYDLTSPLILAIKDKILETLNYYTREEINLTLISGMALGIDTLFAQIAIENKIPFIAAIPCFDQQKMWAESSKKKYEEIIMDELCTVVVVTPKEYDATVMQKRNIWMVDNCNILIAVWDGTSGGTCNCVEYAKSKGKTIIYINPKDIEIWK